jgi:hypothetical protein
MEADGERPKIQNDRLLLLMSKFQGHMTKSINKKVTTRVIRGPIILQSGESF